MIDSLIALMETHTAGAAARILGVSRNAVIGKHNREKLKRGLTLPSAEILGKPKVRIPHRKKPPPAPISTGSVGVVLSMSKPATGRAKGLVGILEVTGCRWPIGEHPKVIGSKVFCNAVLHDGSSYCAAHRADSIASYSRESIRNTIRAAIYVIKRRAA